MSSSSSPSSKSFKYYEFAEKHWKLLIPLEYYNNRSIAKPKASARVSSIATVIPYLAGLVVCIVVYIHQSNQTSSETSIETSDISNNQWTCSMASIITQSVTIDTTNELAISYGLINVNELGSSQCRANLQATSPCINGSLKIQYGDSTDSYFINMLGSSAYNSNGTYFALDFDADNAVNIYKYDSISGQLGQQLISVENELKFCGVATNANGVGTVGCADTTVTTENNLFLNLYTYGTENSVTYRIYSHFYYCPAITSLFTNDNFYNYYLLVTCRPYILWGTILQHSD